MSLPIKVQLISNTVCDSKDSAGGQTEVSSSSKELLQYNISNINRNAKPLLKAKSVQFAIRKQYHLDQ